MWMMCCTEWIDFPLLLSFGLPSTRGRDGAAPNLARTRMMGPDSAGNMLQDIIARYTKRKLL